MDELETITKGLISLELNFLWKMAYLANFTNEIAKTVLVDILKTVTQPENAKKLSEAKSQSGKEMIKM